MLEATPGSGVFDAHYLGPMLNQLVMGVQVQQRLTCITGTEEIDPYIGQRYQVTSSDPGGFQLVAQVSGTSGTTGAGTSSIRTVTTQLPAPAAGHDHLALAVDAHRVGEPPAAGRVQRRHHAALGAQRDAVGRVLDVAAHHDAAVVHPRCRADLVVGVRRVGALHDLDGPRLEVLPVLPGELRSRRGLGRHPALPLR